MPWKDREKELAYFREYHRTHPDKRRKTEESKAKRRISDKAFRDRRNALYPRPVRTIKDPRVPRAPRPVRVKVEKAPKIPKAPKEPRPARIVREKAPKPIKVKKQIEPLKERVFCEPRTVSPGELSARNKAYRVRAKVDCFTAYGGCKCACCGECELLFLTLDHINNDGAKERREGISRRGFGMYLWLRKHGYPPGFRILCFNCNSGRAINGGICPHESFLKMER